MNPSQPPSLSEVPEPNVIKVGGDVDISLFNSPPLLRQRADAIEARVRGEPTDKYIDGKWLPIEEQTAFFFDTRYRVRP